MNVSSGQFSYTFCRISCHLVFFPFLQDYSFPLLDLSLCWFLVCLLSLWLHPFYRLSFLVKLFPFFCFFFLGFLFLGFVFLGFFFLCILNCFWLVSIFTINHWCFNLFFGFITHCITIDILSNITFLPGQLEENPLLTERGNQSLCLLNVYRDTDIFQQVLKILNSMDRINSIAVCVVLPTNRKKRECHLDDTPDPSPGGVPLVDRDVGQVAKYHIKLLLLLLKCFEPLGRIIHDYLVLLRLQLVQHCSTGRPHVLLAALDDHLVNVHHGHKLWLLLHELI